MRELHAPDSAALATCLIRMDPWARLDYGVTAIETYLTRPDPALDRRVIMADGQVAGLICLRHPWLLGPYVEMLAVLPGFQGHGLGRHMLDWAIAKGGRNLWAVVSDFNQGARAFYARQGFVEIAPIPGLISPENAEILLRRVG